MPDPLICPRCGTDLLHPRLEYVFAYLDSANLEGDRTVYGCRCGPLAVVEGGKVAWFYPRAWLLELARKPVVVNALVDEAMAEFRAAHPEVWS